MKVYESQTTDVKHCSCGVSWVEKHSCVENGIFCWFCNETVKDCEHQHNRKQKKMNQFLNWLNYGGNEKTGIQVIDNHYTEYGRGYRDCLGDVYKQLIKTFEVRGLHENK